jgi:hypothetical protein
MRLVVMPKPSTAESSSSDSSTYSYPSQHHLLWNAPSALKGATMTNPLVDFFRCPPNLVSNLPRFKDDWPPPHLTADRLTTWSASSLLAAPHDPHGSRLDISRLIDHFRLERYLQKPSDATDLLLSSDYARSAYYHLRPLLSDSARILLQRIFLRNWRKLPFPRWPVDTSVEDILETLLLWSMRVSGVHDIPFIWFWPNGLSAASIVTHDVETVTGVNAIPDLISVDAAFGIKASFQLVPTKRYALSTAAISFIRRKHCEVNLHGLDHDGNLFANHKKYSKRASEINRYVQELQCEGFRSSCMYRNVDWLEELAISYDMSVPNVAHLEPQRGGCCTVFPYFIGRILELPLTTIQDYSLFKILGDYSMSIWHKQVELIGQKHGLISFIVHPDYIMDRQSLSVYKTLLSHLADQRNRKTLWTPLPGEVNRWWRQRRAMSLELTGGRWRIVGDGQERARIAFASAGADGITYTVAEGSEVEATVPGVA